ncbi:MAG: hypothetical protein WAS73_02840 [Defluviicoccus sp.]
MTIISLPATATPIVNGAVCSLPELIDRARTRLAEARTLPELLDARALAMAARHYARATKARNETQADCLLLIKRAEIRLADEVDAMMERGELARPRGRRKPIRVVRATQEVSATVTSKTPVTSPSADEEIIGG